jgi:glycosyltransferase involved in cell wall biosynthesis
LKRILIFYPYFTPAFKAGGPVQSIRNMVELIKDNFCVDVICSAFDLGEKEALPGVTPDQWISLDARVNVMYIKTRGIRRIKSAFHDRRPDIAYVNGIFLPLFTWLPLWHARKENIPAVFAPRGMLQEGALASGTAKKLLALLFMKLLGLHKNVTWHATDDQEKRDILTRIDKTAIVKVVHNLPARPFSQNSVLKKEPDELRLVFLSLIARKKNLDLILAALKRIERTVILDIYGPVKDKAYWQECLRLMSGQRHPIRYRGPVNPTDVQSTLKNYHALILLTKGENFGHAIYESLSTGTPAIISQFTPWGTLQDDDAGITVNIQDPNEPKAAIERFLSMGQKEFDKVSDGAFRLARQYYNSCDFKSMYVDLFSNNAALDRSHRAEAVPVSKM